MGNIFDIQLNQKPTKEGSFQKIGFAGGSKQVWPMRARVFVNVHSQEEAKPFHEFDIHTKKVKGKFINIECPRNVKGQSCALCSRFFELKAQEKELKAINKKLSDDDLAELFNIRPKKSYYILVNEIGSPEIKLYNIGTTLKASIFGEKELQGALEIYQSMGLSVFDPKEPRGWIEIKRSGSGTDTKYQVSPWSVFDKTTGSSSLVSQSVLPEVEKLLLDPNNMYRIRENFMKNVWTSEEVQQHVESGYTWYPEKVIERYRKIYKIDLSLNAVGDEIFTEQEEQPVARKEFKPAEVKVAEVKKPAPAAPKKPIIDDEDIPF